MVRDHLRSWDHLRTRDLSRLDTQQRAGFFLHDKSFLPLANDEVVLFLSQLIYKQRIDMTGMLVTYLYGKALLNWVGRIPGGVLWKCLGGDVQLEP